MARRDQQDLTETDRAARPGGIRPWQCDDPHVGGVPGSTGRVTTLTWVSDTGQTISISVTGADRPGVTGTLLGALAQVGAEVLDIQQVVVHGQLTLALLLATARRPRRAP